jgi:hypothetical protein
MHDFAKPNIPISAYVSVSLVLEFVYSAPDLRSQITPVACHLGNAFVQKHGRAMQGVYRARSPSMAKTWTLPTWLYASAHKGGLGFELLRSNLNEMQIV